MGICETLTRKRGVDICLVQATLVLNMYKTTLPLCRTLGQNWLGEEGRLALQWAFTRHFTALHVLYELEVSTTRGLQAKLGSP